ncbi:MAG: IS200/IS605 family transposase [Bacteroidia bacterium]|nr:IS200/IS605 family transposase [Bacteroidia bacterium]
MSKSYVSNYVHFTWSTKHRERILTFDIINEMREELFRIAAEKSFWIDIFNGVPDHVHALVALKATQSIAWAAQQMKGITSYWINTQNQISGDFRWQNGYGGFSVSRWDVEMVREYIRRQPEHHSVMNYEQELDVLMGCDKTLLKRNVNP